MCSFHAALLALACAPGAAAPADLRPTALPKGTRAVAIKVEAESLAGGFVLPGSRVDVIVATRTSDGVTARLLLKDVLVLAVDVPGVGGPPLPSTVTLALTPPQVEAATLAAKTGTFRLALRRPD